MSRKMQGHQVGTTMMKGRFLGLLTLLLCFESGIAASPNTGKNYAGDSNTLPGPPPPQHHSGGSEPVRQPSSPARTYGGGSGGTQEIRYQQPVAAEPYAQPPSGWPSDGRDSGRDGAEQSRHLRGDGQSETLRSESYNVGTYNGQGTDRTDQHSQAKVEICKKCEVCDGCTVHGKNDKDCKILVELVTLYLSEADRTQRTLGPLQTHSNANERKNKVCYCAIKKWTTGAAGLFLGVGGGVSVFSGLDIIKTTDAAAGDALTFSLLAVAGISFVFLCWMCCREKNNVHIRRFVAFVTTVSTGILGAGSIVAIAISQASVEGTWATGFQLGMWGAALVCVVGFGLAICCYNKKSVCCYASTELPVNKFM